MTISIPSGTSTYTLSSSNTVASNAGTRGSLAGNASGVEITGSDDTVINTGSILGGGNYSAVVVWLGAVGNSLTNAAGALIANGSTEPAVDLFAAAYLQNNGTIQGYDTVTAVYFQAGGTIVNGVSGRVLGGVVGVTDVAVTVTNSGKIFADTVGGYGAIGLTGGGVVTNLAGGTLSGVGYGVHIVGAAGTITNAGVINGGSGDAILLGSGTSYTNRVIVDAGASFVGVVDGGRQAVLELASSGSVGTLVATASQFTNFATLSLDAGAQWTIKGDSGLSGEFTTIAGFTAGDTFQFTGNHTIASQTASGGVTHVTLSNSGGTLTFAGTESFQAGYSAGVTTLTEITGPSLTTGGTVTFTGGGAAATLDSTAVVSDPNSITGATVAISGFVAGDQLNFTNTLGITGSFNTATGVLTLSGTASAANFQTALESVTFNVSPTNVDPTQAGNHTTRTINWTVVDANGSTSGTSGIVTQESSVLNYGTTIQENGIVAATETVSAGVMTLKNGGGTTVGSITVGASLSTGEFLLSNDGTNSTIVLDTVFGTYTSGVTLLTNPTTIASTGKATNTAASGNAISGPSGTNWTVTNLGTVAETGATTPIGISLAASGTVINAGSIGATTSASAGIGVSLAAGGVVTNQSGGAISGPFGVQVAAAAGTVVNAGTISGTTTVSTRAGVRLSGGGSVTNQSGGTISGFYGVWGQTTAISVVNQGVIIGNLGSSLGVGAYLAEGGTLTNAATASITGANAVYVNGAAGTIQNAGTITGNATNATDAGVYLRAAASSLTNQSGGTITGFRGAKAIASTVVNAGSIGGNTTSASGAGVLLTTAGVLTNQSGGTVTGFLGVYNNSGAATVVNAGVIAGDASTGKGISFKGAGTVTNQSGGTISGGADAVQFAAGVTNRLVDNPGAVFTGTVNGGNTIGAASISTLELASGASTGTLTGLGSQYVGFAAVTIDSGANWTFAGTNTLASGATLTNSGTDTVIGTLVNAGQVTATGTLTGVSIGASGLVSNQSGGTIAGYYAAVVSSATGTLVNSGRISAASTGAGTGVKLANGGSFTNNAGGTVTGDIGVYATGASAATIVNAGSINGQGGGNNGVALLGGGIFTNLAGGTVTNGAFFLGVAGTLVNAGYITGTHASVSLTSGGTVVNQSGGTLKGSLAAVQFTAGRTARVIDDPGAVFIGKVEGGNTIGAASISTLELASGASTGTLIGLGAQFTHFAQVTIDAGATWTISGAASAFSTLTNAGSVTGGITLGAGTLTVSNQSTGTINGGGSYAIYDSSGAATVVNAGLITAASNIAVALLDGGRITNQSGGTITGSGAGGNGYAAVLGEGAAVTVTNAGVIDGTATNGTGVLLRTGGLVTNQSGGTIESAYIGVHFSQNLATLVNAGIISGNSTVSGGSGVSVNAGGSVTNLSGGTITGYYGVKVTSVAATVVNAGVIAGNYTSNYNNADGVYLAAGGSVTNQATGNIYGRNDGVKIYGARGTVVNLGSIHSRINATYGGQGVSLADGGLIVNGTTGGTASTAFIGGYNYAIQFGTTGTDTLMNYGTVSGEPGTVAVSMYTGTLINGASGATGALIEGGEQASAVLISGAGTVINDATISSYTPHYASNIGFGVSLGGGGTISNLGSLSLIEAYLPVYAGQGATVINAGTIKSHYGPGTGAFAVVLGGGTNRLIIDPGAVFVGTVHGSGTVTASVAQYPGATSFTTTTLASAVGTATLELASGASAGTLSGLGTKYVGFAAVTIDSGAQWTFAGSNMLGVGITLTNSGTDTVIGTFTNGGMITGATLGIVIGTGGLITNQSGGTINGGTFAISGSVAGTVTNYGLITGSNATRGLAIDLQAGGSVLNRSGGTISGNLGGIYVRGAAGGTIVNAGLVGAGTTAGAGVKLVNANGSITNQSGGTITGQSGIVEYDAAAVTNAGSIGGNAGTTVGFGVELGAGSVTNQSGGVITGFDGIYVSNSSGQVVNAGSVGGGGAGVKLKDGGTITNLPGGVISGSTDSVLFGAGFTGRLVVDPGATFSGTVDGGNTIGATSISTLELASGASAGTLSGFGSQYINFAHITFDAGAHWDVIGSDGASALAGATISGFSYGDTIDVTNFSATGSSFSGNELTLTSGASTISIDITGNFITQQFHISSDGTTGTDIILQAPTLDYGATLDEAGIVATSETVNAGQMTLFNAGNTAVGTVGVGTSLNSGDFLVSNNGTNTTLVLDTVFRTYTSPVTLLTNPTTIASTAKVTGSLASTTGVSGPSGTAWTLTNLGTVSETGTASFGVSLASGGTITNAASAVISAGTAGVYFNGGTGSVSNAGSIAGSANFGIRFGSTSTGGTVSNQSGGVITGASDAVYFNTGSGAGTVSNSGTIAGGTSGFGGINLSGGGLVSNAPGGTITGHAAGVFVAVATGTVGNAGSIGATAYGVWLENGGTVTNMSGGVVTGSYGASSAAGVYFSAGGAVTNQSGGTIGGLRGVYVVGAAATVVNAGHIVGSNTTIGAGAASTGAGLYLGAGGSVTNQSGGTISGFDGVYASNLAATVVNAGSIGGNTASGIGIKLTGGGSVTNQSGGLISGYYAVSASAVATVSNVGTITGVGSYAAGVRLNAGGLVTNQSGGTISGANGVVGGAAAFTVINAGSIAGSQAAYSGDAGVGLFGGGTLTNLSGGVITGDYAVNATTAPATISNAGIISGIIGVELNAAAQVTNQSGGTINGSHLGVQVINHVGTVVNAGSIGGTSYYGVQLSNGGTITNQSGGTISGGVDAVKFGAGATNRLVIDPGAVFTGTVDGGNTIGAASISTLELASGASAGTLTGLGSQFINFAQDTIDPGANWTLSGANTLVHGATLTDSGTLTDTGTFTNAGLVTGAANGVILTSGAQVANQSGGTIGGYWGVYAKAGTATVVNAGAISGNVLSGRGIYFAAGGAVTNLSGGMITGGSFGVFVSGGAGTVSNSGRIGAGSGFGVALRSGGTVTNASGGTITGIDFIAGAGTVSNTGSIAGEVELQQGGFVSNASGGTIIGAPGVAILGAVGTVQNDGYIDGTSGIGISFNAGGTITNLSGGTIKGATDAVTFASGFTNRLVDNAGAVFIGTVDGGNTIGATSISALELASGTSTGTLNGFGSQYINFAQITIDSGAQWDIIGNDAATALAGATISGFSYGDTIDVTNFAATSSAFSGNELTLTSGASTISIDITGNFITQQFRVTNDGGTGTDIILQAATLDYGATFDEAGIVATSETVNAGQMTLFNSGNTAVGTVGVGTSLNSGDFLVSNNGTNSTIVLDTVFGTYTSTVTLLTNPTTIASTAKITGTLASATGVSGPSGTAWTLTNLGTVSETGTASFGVSLASGGTITNAASAVISAGGDGVYLHSGAGSVSNAGSIAGTGTSGFGIRFGSTSSGGTVSNQSGGVITGAVDAIYFNTGSGAGTVSNSGKITGGTSGFAAINLSGGGSVTNAPGGTISGSQAGVFIANGSGATVTNAGSIGASQSYGIWLENAGTVTNASGGRITGGYATADAAGVYFGDGGAVTNQSGGIIGGLRGVYVLSGAATVVNAGHIVGSNTTIGAGANQTGAGIYLGDGGSVTNQAGGSITGFDGVLVSAAAATVSNAGFIDGSYGASLGAGGLVTNATGGTITGDTGVFVGGGAGTVQNAGSIGGATASSLHAGIELTDGGSITNQTGGVVTGYYGVWSTGTAVAVVNAGSILGNMSASFGSGVYLVAGGSVTNQSGGLISGYYGVDAGSGTVSVVNAGTIRGNATAALGNGVYLGATGVVSNQAGGTITAEYAIGAITVSATVVNAGSIGGNTTSSGTSHPAGVFLGAGGAVTNQLGGSITGYIGVVARNTAVTVTNAGVIDGTFGVSLDAGGLVTNQSGGTIAGSIDAVTFASGFTNRVVVDPGAVFTGTVDGGNMIGASSISTLELASGATVGTLSGLGTKYVDFARVTVDAGANWVLAGANTVQSGVTLTDSGTLTDTGTLIDAGSITGNVLRLSGGALTNQSGGVISSAYIYGVGTGGTDTILNQGIITGTAGASIYFKAAGNVTNTTGALISDAYGVKLKGVNATLVNQGVITATDTIDVSVFGAYLRNGGLVINGQANGSTTSTASIQGYYGIVFKSVDTLNASGTLENYGTIESYHRGEAVSLGNGGTVFNGLSGASGALIQGYFDGVYAQNGSVTNAGSIIARGTSPTYGIFIESDGTVSNLGSASLIEGYTGIHIDVDGTVVNQGTIESNQGTAGTAIQFTGGNARLVESPTATLVGGVYGGTGGTAVLELASGASAGTISGLGTNVVNFTSLVFDDGSQWTVAGNDSANGLGTLGISGFTYGDTIDLTNFAAVNRAFSSNTLVVGDGIGDYETLHIAGTFITNQFQIVADGSGGTDIDVRQIPSITAGATVTFTGGGSAVTLDPGLAVTDAGSTTLTSAEVWIGSGFIDGDVLNFVNTGTISGSYNATTGTLTLTGTDTVADYQAALDSITYSFSPSNGDPTNGGGATSRTIDWSASDGVSTSVTTTSALDVVHAAPTISASGTVTYAAGGFATALDPTITVSDPDSSDVLVSATIVINNGFFTGDQLTFTNQNGITGSYDPLHGLLFLNGAASVADYIAALQSITYSFAGSDPTIGNTDNFRTIDWVVNDGSASNNLSNAGTSTVHVIKQPPTITGTVAGQTTTDEAAVDPFSGVTIGDPNTGQTETVTITLSNNADGTLSNLGIGSYDSKAGDYVFTGTTLAVTSALDALVFTPTAHQVVPGDTVTTTFTIAATDNFGVTTTDTTTTVIATAVNDPASLTGTLSNYAMANQGTSTPFANLTVIDPDVGHTDTVTITLSNPSFGTLSNLGGGVFNSGTYTITDTPTAVTTAIDGLVLTPNAPSAGVYLTSTTVTVDVTGPGGGPSPSSFVTAAVEQIFGLATVPSAQLQISLSTDGSSFATAVGGDTNEAVVTSPAADGTFVLPSGYQAEYLGGNAAALLTDPTEGDAVLVGNSGNDTISAVAANDSLAGGNGNNIFYGGPGQIAVVAGDGANTVNLPSDATYSVSLGNGNDTVYASGAGTITGGTGSNVFSTEPGAGTNLVNSNGTDLIYADGTQTNASISGAADLVAGAGTVDVTVTGAAASVAAAGGSVNVTTSGSDGFYYEGSSSLDLTDNGSADTVTAGSGAVTVSASTSPLVYGGSGSLLVEGGAGTPTVIGGSGGGSIVGGAGGAVAAGGTGTLTVRGAATLFGGAGGVIDYVGSVGGAKYYAGAGAETIDASASSANNLLIGSGDSTGATQIITGTGQDTVAMGVGAVTVDATASPLIFGASGSLVVEGGAGTPTVVGGSGGASIVGGAGGVIVAAEAGTPTVSGAATIYGAAGGAVDYVGGSGGALFAFEAGAETLNAAGSSTSNLIYAGNLAGSADEVIDGSGFDTVITGVGATTIQATTGQELVGATSGDVQFIGGSGAATVFAGSGHESVSGGAGGVTFVEGSGPATLSGNVTAFGTAGGEIDYTGSSGSLSYYAETGAETVNAASSSTNNVLWASANPSSTDVLTGGSGNDVLVGGAGADTLTGGGGSNFFTFVAGHGGGNVVVTDFTGSDTLSLIGYGSNAGVNAFLDATSSGGNTTVTLSDNTSVTFLGVASRLDLIGHITSV